MPPRQTAAVNAPTHLVGRNFTGELFTIAREGEERGNTEGTGETVLSSQKYGIRIIARVAILMLGRQASPPVHFAGR
jgi:hypothetical protein